MTTYQVAGCVHRFEYLFGLVKEKTEDSASEKPSLIDQQDTNLLEKTIFNYSKKENCCGKIKRFFYLVWQAVKQLFCVRSDWQNATRMLSDRLVKNFDYGEMTADQRKTVIADVGVVAEQFLLQLVEANEKNKRDLDGFETRTSSHKSELYGATQKDNFSHILRGLAQTCFVTKNCRDFIERLPEALQKRVTSKLKTVAVSKQIQMIQTFEEHCKDPKYVETTSQKISENHKKVRDMDADQGYKSIEKHQEINSYHDAYNALLKQAFGIESMGEF